MTALEYLTEIGLTLVWYFYLKLVCINVSFFFWWIFLILIHLLAVIAVMTLWWMIPSWDWCRRSESTYRTWKSKCCVYIQAALGRLTVLHHLNGISVLYAYLYTCFGRHMSDILCVSKNAFSSPRSRMEEVWLIMYLLFLTCCPFRGCVCRNLEIQYFFFSLANNPYIIFRNRTGFPKQNHSSVKSRKSFWSKETETEMQVEVVCIVCIVWFPSRKTKKSWWT